LSCIVFHLFHRGNKYSHSGVVAVSATGFRQKRLPEMEKSNCHAAWICALKTGGFFLFGYLVGRRFNLSCPFLSGSGSSCDIPSLKKKVLTINEMPTSQSLIKRVQEEEPNLLEPKRNVDPTPVDVLGPFYVIGAPFRAKLCPIYATGRKLLICGTLRDSSGHFVPFTVIDFWQVYSFQSSGC
jgi:hypothetical protein